MRKSLAPHSMRWVFSSGGKGCSVEGVQAWNNPWIVRQPSGRLAIGVWENGKATNQPPRHPASPPKFALQKET